MNCKQHLEKRNVGAYPPFPALPVTETCIPMSVMLTTMRGEGANNEGKQALSVLMGEVRSVARRWC
jgi:hypothetical protein